MSEPAPEQHHVPVGLAARGAQQFQGMRAGVVTRTFAGAVDYAIITLAVLGSYAGVAVLWFLFDPRNFSSPSWSFLEFVLLGWALMFCYLTIAWASTGRTVGASLMGVRVVSVRGDRMRLAGAALRALFCVLFPIGLFWCAINRKNRSVQDMVLRTSVIHDWTRRSVGAPHRLDAGRD